MQLVNLSKQVRIGLNIVVCSFECNDFWKLRNNRSPADRRTHCQARLPQKEIVLPKTLDLRCSNPKTYWIHGAMTLYRSRSPLFWPRSALDPRWSCFTTPSIHGDLTPQRSRSTEIWPLRWSHSITSSLSHPYFLLNSSLLKCQLISLHDVTILVVPIRYLYATFAVLSLQYRNNDYYINTTCQIVPY